VNYLAQSGDRQTAFWHDAGPGKFRVIFTSTLLEP